MRDMQRTHVSGFDLKLLPALEALLEHRNVTRAAAEVGLSQPAMSRVLSRLRQLQADPLLVRAGKGYALTARAKEIQPQVVAAIRNLREVFLRHDFDPARERRTVCVAAPDAAAILLIPDIAARLALEAPGIELRVESYRADTVERLESGEIDVVFALASTPLPPHVFSETFAVDRLALVMRAGHPAARRKVSIADYGKFDHVGIALVGDGRSELDALLAAQGVARRIAVVTPYFMAALATVARTDLVTTISAALASKFASPLGLVVREPPFRETKLDMTLVCSHVRANAPFLAWLRTSFRSVATEVLSPPPARDRTPRHHSSKR